jgi:hypothetical protein
MEKRGDINPAYTPPEVEACHARVNEFKQRLFKFADSANAQEKIAALDADFRKDAAERVKNNTPST